MSDDTGIMTLATASVFAGVALMLTVGVPVYGMPKEFSDTFGYSMILGIATPIWFAAVPAVNSGRV